MKYGLQKLKRATWNEPTQAQTTLNTAFFKRGLKIIWKKLWCQLVYLWGVGVVLLIKWNIRTHQQFHMSINVQSYFLIQINLFQESFLFHLLGIMYHRNTKTLQFTYLTCTLNLYSISPHLSYTANFSNASSIWNSFLQNINNLELYTTSCTLKEICQNLMFYLVTFIHS